MAKKPVKKRKAKKSGTSSPLRDLTAKSIKRVTGGADNKPHTKTIKDAVRKMLDQVAEINRATQL
jgi:hypothetical protein